MHGLLLLTSCIFPGRVFLCASLILSAMLFVYSGQFPVSIGSPQFAELFPEFVLLLKALPSSLPPPQFCRSRRALRYAYEFIAVNPLNLLPQHANIVCLICYCSKGIKILPFNVNLLAEARAKRDRQLNALSIVRLRRT